ncbi:hypothetical protein TSAR_007648 [Trichomalopsis sarcophagae]|uniref:Uncharacterized protein n=1 Tax=Trichomalopsis sarcophagae TaxID=543379 RepID=A0A232EVH1_9HYME|nr:hypothetical protein TSAR_007648 [Trichomalopsis sarcophagae]
MPICSRICSASSEKAGHFWGSEPTFLRSLGHPEPEKPWVPAITKYLFFYGHFKFSYGNLTWEK